MPDSPNAADTLGWAHYHQGNYTMAVSLLEEAANRVPGNATFQYHLGMAYQKIHDRERARLHLEKALHLAPNFLEAAEIRQSLESLKTEHPF